MEFIKEYDESNVDGLVVINKFKNIFIINYINLKNL